MNAHEFRTESRAVLARYPELFAGLPEHADEVRRIVARILEAEEEQPCPWATLSDQERARAFDAAYPPGGAS